MIHHIVHIRLPVHDPDRLSLHEIHALPAARACAFPVSLTLELGRRNIPRGDDALDILRLRQREFIIIAGPQKLLVINAAMVAFVFRQGRAHIHASIHNRNSSAFYIAKLPIAFWAAICFFLIQNQFRNCHISHQSLSLRLRHFHDIVFHKNKKIPAALREKF